MYRYGYTLTSYDNRLMMEDDYVDRLMVYILINLFDRIELELYIP